MKTIAERATEFAQNYEFAEKDMECGNCATCSKCKDYRRFVDIVTEQRTIDTERAWTLAYSMYQAGKEHLTPLTKDEFIKAMEE